MEPALEELFAEGEAEDEVPIILRLADPTAIPDGTRIITRQGLIATARVRRGDIPKVWAEQSVESMKAARLYGPTPAPDELPEVDPLGLEPRPTDQRRPDAELPPGKEVLVAHIDWGVDVAHPEFRNPDGSTRLLALWDQSCPADPRAPNRYGYGRIYTREEIDRALAAANPYAALGFDPAASDPVRRGSHGTHTLSISAGNGRGGGPIGLAPEAQLCSVQLSTAGPDGPVLLGDSVALIEAFDFIAGVAGPRPFVINCSLGRQCGEHDGLTLTERAMDAFLRMADGRAICFSGGNYYDRQMHARGLLRPGEVRRLGIVLQDGDPGPTEVDLWYPGPDRFGLSLVPPGGRAEVRLAPGVRADVVVDGRRVGRGYHRICDPNCYDNEMTLFLDRTAPRGVWELSLSGDDIADGRFHAWIERTGGAARHHPRFAGGDADPTSTTGTICNGLWTIAVGAYDAHRAERPLAHFSSSGPTRNGRQKPDLVAPGCQVLAARSCPAGEAPGVGRLARMSGTSMAAPHVTGTIALMFAAAPRPLSIAETRRLLLGTTVRPEAVVAEDELRIGSGFLDTAAAVAAAARVGGGARVEAAEKPAAPEAESEAADGGRLVVEGAIAPEGAEPEAAAGRDTGEDGDVKAAEGAEAEAADLLPTKPVFEAVAEPEPADALASEAAFEAVAEPEAAVLLPSEPVLEAVAESAAIAGGEDHLWLASDSPSPGALARDLVATREPEGKGAEAEAAVATETVAEPGWAVDVSPYPPPDETRAIGERVLVAAEALAAGAPGPSALFLQSLIEAALDEDAALGPAPSAAHLFHAFARPWVDQLEPSYRRHFVLLAGPGDSCQDLVPRPGDLIVRLARGESFAVIGVVAQPGLVAHSRLAALGLRAEGGPPLAPGFYVHVVEAGARPSVSDARLARRLADARRAVLPDTLMLRLRRPGAEADESEEVAHPLIRIGSRGPAVSEAQSKLNTVHAREIAAGSPGLAACPLAVDGIFGPRTRQAAVAFQRLAFPDAPREWDGVIGPKTWAQLDLYLERQQPTALALNPPRWRPILAASISRRASLRANNAVRFLIDGPETFRAMVEAMRSAEDATHFIYLLGWKLVDDFEMIPGDASSTARRLLADASARRVQIRAMLWAKPPLENRDEVARINRLPTGGAIRDNETPHPLIGAHHQKLLVVKGSRGLIGFVGGLDINSDRITVVGATQGEPLHDVHCRIMGPAARDALETFVRRWDHHPDHAGIDAARGGLLGRSEPVPPPVGSPPPGSTSTGATCTVAVARTFNPVTTGTSLPRERDIRALLLAAIGAVERFIYIEDQYLIDLDTAAALRAVVPRLSHLTILIAASEISDLPCVWKFRRDFVAALTGGLGAADLAKVRIFDRVTPPRARPTFGRHTYVHAKCWVFDDELAVIGSANCNRRGYQHDSEVNAFVFDDAAPEMGRMSFAQAMRMALWSEHLAVAPSAVTDGVASAGLWLVPPAGAAVRPYNPGGGRDRTPDAVCDATRDTIDPGLP